MLLMLGYQVTVRGWQHVAPARRAGAVLLLAAVLGVVVLFLPDPASVG